MQSVTLTAAAVLQKHAHPRDSSYSQTSFGEDNEQGHLLAVRTAGCHIHPSSFCGLRLLW